MCSKFCRLFFEPHEFLVSRQEKKKKKKKKKINESFLVDIFSQSAKGSKQTTSLNFDYFQLWPICYVSLSFSVSVCVSVRWPFQIVATFSWLIAKSTAGNDGAEHGFRFKPTAKAFSNLTQSLTARTESEPDQGFHCGRILRVCHRCLFTHVGPSVCVCESVNIGIAGAERSKCLGHLRYASGQARPKTRQTRRRSSWSASCPKRVKEGPSCHNIPAKRKDVGYHVNKLPLKSKSNVDN